MDGLKRSRGGLRAEEVNLIWIHPSMVQAPVDEPGRVPDPGSRKRRFRELTESKSGEASRALDTPASRRRIRRTEQAHGIGCSMPQAMSFGAD